MKRITAEKPDWFPKYPEFVFDRDGIMLEVPLNKY